MLATKEMNAPDKFSWCHTSARAIGFVQLNWLDSTAVNKEEVLDSQETTV
jgi:hypothetical protein